MSWQLCRQTESRQSVITPWRHQNYNHVLQGEMVAVHADVCAAGNLVLHYTLCTRILLPQVSVGTGKASRLPVVGQLLVVGCCAPIFCNAKQHASTIQGSGVKVSRIMPGPPTLPVLWSVCMVPGILSWYVLSRVLHVSCTSYALLHLHACMHTCHFFQAARSATGSSSIVSRICHTTADCMRMVCLMRMLPLAWEGLSDCLYEKTYFCCVAWILVWWW